MTPNLFVIHSSEDVKRVVYSDFYIRYNRHPLYSESTLYTKDRLSQLITKLEMILFTNVGDVISDPLMGCDLERYLHDFFVSTDSVKRTITEQIKNYIPELVGNYEMGIRILFADSEENPTLQHIMYIYFVIDEQQFIYQIASS